jgi:hypothetical protein
MPVTIDEVLGRLDGVERNGDGWRARCPVHKGPRRSLTIRRGTHLVALFRCWAVNCAVDDILAAIKLTRADLRATRRENPETVYVLRDAAGAVVAEHVRIRRPNGEKRMFWRRNGTPKLKGVKVTDLPLYGADTVAQVEAGASVAVTEGEKPKEALSARRILAVGTVTGAATIPCDAVLRQLLAYDVILWPDNDDIGRAHMTRIGRRLLAMGISAPPRWVEWPDAPPAGDAADFPGDAAALAALLATARPFDPGCPSEHEAAAVASSGLPVIVVSKRPLRDITTDALAALAHATDGCTPSSSRRRRLAQARSSPGSIAWTHARRATRRRGDRARRVFRRRHRRRRRDRRRSRRHAVPAPRLGDIADDPRGRDDVLRRDRARGGNGDGVARHRRGERRESDLDRRAVPSRDRRVGTAHPATRAGWT